MLTDTVLEFQIQHPVCSVFICIVFQHKIFLLDLDKGILLHTPLDLTSNQATTSVLYKLGLVCCCRRSKQRPYLTTSTQLLSHRGKTAI